MTLETEAQNWHFLLPVMLYSFLTDWTNMEPLDVCFEQMS